MTTPSSLFPDRAILHVDMDAFYASVEVLDDPSLKGKPVMVGGTPEGRGVVAAASYEARKYGVHSAMSAARAVKLCPDGIFLRGRMERYAEISQQVFAIFDDFTPLVEPLSIDEAFLDVTGCRRLFGSAEQVGRSIKQRILDEVGLVASVGLASNKFLAKLASDLDKPDGFVIIPPAEARDLLASLPIGKLWGVGKVAEKQMHRFGIRKVGDMLAIPPDLLIAQFGDHAAHLLELAVGHDERPVIPLHDAKSIGNETTFREDIADAMHLQDILDELAAKVARRLRSHGFLARTVTLKARYPDFTTHTRSETLPEPSDSSVDIRDTARRLLEVKLGRKGRALRLIGVTASNLVPPGQGQGQLFVDVDRERDRKLDRIMDRIHGKYGPMLKRGGGKPRS
jgi:DNA polymerase-4